LFGIRVASSAVTHVFGLPARAIAGHRTSMSEIRIIAILFWGIALSLRRIAEEGNRGP